MKKNCPAAGEQKSATMIQGLSMDCSDFDSGNIATGGHPNTVIAKDSRRCFARRQAVRKTGIMETDVSAARPGSRGNDPVIKLFRNFKSFTFRD